MAIENGNLKLVKALVNSTATRRTIVSGINKSIKVGRREFLKTLLDAAGDTEETWLDVFENINQTNHNGALKLFETPEGQTWEARMWYAKLFGLSLLEEISKRKINPGHV